MHAGDQRWLGIQRVLILSLRITCVAVDTQPKTADPRHLPLEFSDPEAHAPHPTPIATQVNLEIVHLQREGTPPLAVNTQTPIAGSGATGQMQVSEKKKQKTVEMEPYEIAVFTGQK